ncbi:MAG: acylphosphatase [Chloroflexota bacterium]|nr:acylphosphatase [Chloroflexota bacterium]
MTAMSSISVKVRGHVQGVYFRAFVQKQAQSLGLTGYTRNLLDSNMVEVQAEGTKEKLNKLIQHLEVGPPGSRVDTMDIDWTEYKSEFDDFSIRY